MLLKNETTKYHIAGKGKLTRLIKPTRNLQGSGLIKLAKIRRPFPRDIEALKNLERGDSYLV